MYFAQQTLLKAKVDEKKLRGIFEELHFIINHWRESIEHSLSIPDISKEMLKSNSYQIALFEIDERGDLVFSDVVRYLLQENYSPLMKFIEKHHLSHVYAIIVIFEAIRFEDCKEQSTMKFPATYVIYKSTFNLLMFETQLDKEYIKGFMHADLEKSKSEIQKNALKNIASKGGVVTKHKRQNIIETAASICNKKDYPSIKNAAEHICEEVVQIDKQMGGRLYKNKDQVRAVNRILTNAKNQGLLSHIK